MHRELKLLRTAQSVARLSIRICQIYGAGLGQRWENGEDRQSVREWAKAGRSRKVFAQREELGDTITVVQGRPRWLKNLCFIKIIKIHKI